MPFCNHSTKNNVLECRQSLLELQILRDFFCDFLQFSLLSANATSFQVIHNYLGLGYPISIAALSKLSRLLCG
jgi:hypothetical protein